MISMDDFKKKDGSIDWEAYHSAEIEHGEKCYSCGVFIFPSTTHNRSKCFSCKELDKNKKEVSHTKLLRCPNCGHQWKPEDTDEYEIYQEGDHDTTCPECDHEFLIITYVTYTFTSPKMVKKEKSEVSDANQKV